MDIWVDKESLVIRASGPIDGECSFEGQEKCIKIVSDKSPTEVTAVRDPDTGEITLHLDPLKVEAKLDIMMIQLRMDRNSRLIASDWTQFTDSPLSPEKKTEWATYRQALRDLPGTVTDPTNVTWPTPPS